MQEKYYEQIKDKIVDTEVVCQIKDYTKNKVIVENYYEIGKLLVEAQGGEKRAKYGDKIIKEYSEKLVVDVGKKYGEKTLRRMRKFYVMFKDEIWTPLVSKLSWSHFLILMTLKDSNEITYYINRCISERLSKRQLQNLIKNNEYDRLEDKSKIKLINQTKIELIDEIKNPIIIKSSNKTVLNEKQLQRIILEKWEEFLKELGPGFSIIRSEYPIKLGNKYNYIDILLYNIIYKCYVVMELKIGKLKKEHIGQISVYMNYIDKHLRDNIDNTTIGIIICSHNDKLVMEYVSDNRIISREYVLT